MQVQEIMTSQVIAVAPDTSAKSASKMMAGRGFAALPVQMVRWRIGWRPWLTAVSPVLAPTKWT